MTTETLTEKDARQLAKQIVKDASNVLVKFGQVNGRRILHVYVPGKNNMSRNVESYAEWLNHPAAAKKARELAPSEDELVITQAVKNKEAQ